VEKSRMLGKHWSSSGGASYATLLTQSSGSESDENGKVGNTTIVPTLLEIEWAEMVKAVEEEKREQGSVSALDMFGGKPQQPPHTKHA
jgi:hypothetical protein